MEGLSACKTLGMAMLLQVKPNVPVPGLSNKLIEEGHTTPFHCLQNCHRRLWGKGIKDRAFSIDNFNKYLHSVCVSISRKACHLRGVLGRAKGWYRARCLCVGNIIWWLHNNLSPHGLLRAANEEGCEGWVRGLERPDMSKAVTRCRWSGHTDSHKIACWL